jgi:hypothetical protein
MAIELAPRIFENSANRRDQRSEMTTDATVGPAKGEGWPADGGSWIADCRPFTSISQSPP